MSRRPGEPRKVSVLERRRRLKKMARNFVGKPRAHRDRILQAAKTIFLDPAICDDCWALPCVCLPFPCPCGGTIEVLGKPGEDIPEHSAPACAQYIADPPGHASKIIEPYRKLEKETS